MPELPEVETIVRDLNKKVLGRKIEGVWSDWQKMVKIPKNFSLFEKEIKNKKINKIYRRGKNIIFELSGDKVLLAHQKMTGHFLHGKWTFKDKKWTSLLGGPLRNDPMNKFLHFMFFLDNGYQLALSDLRKFAKIELWNKEDFNAIGVVNRLGEEPLGSNFTFLKFKKILKGKVSGKIKQVLMDQSKIAGIGNIYADEILWEAKINPAIPIHNLSEKQLKNVFYAIKKILKKALKMGGTSISDFRKLSGEKGLFSDERKVYRRKDEDCLRCKAKIKRIVLAQRGTYFCPACQRLMS